MVSRLFGYKTYTTALIIAVRPIAFSLMPLREGKMTCTSCHNPHGSISNVKALKVGSSVAELCESCHGDQTPHNRRWKRGGRVGRLPGERDDRYLPDHAEQPDGRTLRRVVEPANPELVGSRPRGG